jgi:hypothetical protein
MGGALIFEKRVIPSEVENFVIPSEVENFVIPSEVEGRAAMVPICHSPVVAKGRVTLTRASFV